MIPLNEGEHVLIEVRKHWFIFFSRVFFIFLASFVPVILFVLSESLSLNFKTIGNTTALFCFISLIWTLALWIIVFIIWTNYYLDVFILTNKRLIEIEQIDLFERQVSALDLDKIQDVTSIVKGVVSTYFNYGTLFIQSAGKEKEFILYDIVDPHSLRQLVNETVIKLKQSS